MCNIANASLKYVSCVCVCVSFGVCAGGARLFSLAGVSLSLWPKGEQKKEDHLQPTLEPTQEVYAPKCLCLLSTWPYFEQFREWFLNLYRISLSPSQVGTPPSPVPRPPLPHNSCSTILYYLYDVNSNHFPVWTALSKPKCWFV